MHKLTYLVHPVHCCTSGYTQSFHPSLSARSIASLHVISMHRMSSRINVVSCQFFRGLPLLRFPSGLRSMACTARLCPSILASCPIQRSLKCIKTHQQLMENLKTQAPKCFLAASLL